MGLAVRYHEATPHPIFICDSCGKEIEDWKEALVSYEMPTHGETVCIAYIYHNGCESGTPIHYELGGPVRYPLSSYLPVLLYNHNWGARRRREESNEVITEVCVEVKRTMR